MRTLTFVLPFVAALFLSACGGSDPGAFERGLQQGKQEGRASLQSQLDDLKSINSRQEVELKSVRPKVEVLEGRAEELKRIIGFMTDPLVLATTVGQVLANSKPWMKESAHGISSGVTFENGPFNSESIPILTNWIFNGGSAQFQHLYAKTKTALVPYAERLSIYIVPNRVIFERPYDPVLAGHAASIRFRNCSFGNEGTDDHAEAKCEAGRKAIALKYGFKEGAIPKDALWWLAFLDRRYVDNGPEVEKAVQAAMLDLVKTISKK